MSVLPEYRAIRGDTIPFTFDQIVDLNGDTVTSLVGWKCVFTLKDKLSDTAPRITKSTTLSGADAVSISGTSFTGSITPAESALLTPGKFYPFDLQLTDPQGRISTVRSVLIVEADINQTNT